MAARPGQREQRPARGSCPHWSRSHAALCASHLPPHHIPSVAPPGLGSAERKGTARWGSPVSPRPALPRTWSPVGVGAAVSLVARCPWFTHSNSSWLPLPNSPAWAAPQVLGPGTSRLCWRVFLAGRLSPPLPPQVVLFCPEKPDFDTKKKKR
uniref:Uncharacterized protein n=1 Tax=Molossus molossus TaxID=27622 RepID=A0A7J8CRY2_MOLMO|nr:hypothetical protein HJG59_009830 [Molossus molossus]